MNATDPGPQAAAPVVRLSLFIPFVQELKRRQLDYESLFHASNISPKAVFDSNSFVPAPVMYRIVEEASLLAEDPFLAVTVGESLNFALWSPFVDAVTSSRCLADFLLRFVISARKEASSVQYFLEASQTVGSFRQVRTSKPAFKPSQVDGFTTSYTLKLISLAIGDRWSPDQVSAAVCDPGVLPPNYRGVRILQGDRMGVVVQFPVEWLLQDLDRNLFAESVKLQSNDQLPLSFKDTLRSTLKMNLSLRDLNVESVSRLFGISRQTLQRKLRAEGTTLSTEISDLKRHKACELLITTREPIEDIGISLGFENGASFSRAFKSWTGQSPKAFRHSSNENGNRRE